MTGFPVSVVTLFPEWVRTVCEHGVIGRAATRSMLRLDTVDPRAFAPDVHRTVDERPFGGGPGMVGTFAPWVAAIRAARAAVPGAPVVLMSPQGERLDQARLAELATLPGLVLVAARYEGLDERIVEAEIDSELSLGDYVLSGGELPAMAVIDGLARLLPGVLGHAGSAAADSFADGLLEGPQYTRPAEVEGRGVPPVLMSGDHQAIARWRRQQMLGRTSVRRPDLIDEAALSDDDRALLEEFRAGITAQGD